MRKTSKIILITIIATSILLGLGYAAIQNITLNITGTATGVINQDNFKVRFTSVTNVSDAVNVTASVSSDTLATMNVSGLTERGDNVTATFEIENQSADLSSDLKISTTNSNTEYFLISSRLKESSLTAGEKTTVTVNVELLKTPIEGSESSSIGVKLEAMPVEPGKEGTSEGTNDFAQTPELKNEYGFYFWEGYSFQMDGKKATFVFFEGGNGALFIDDVLFQVIPLRSFEYDTLAVDIDGMGEYTYFSPDGKQLLLDEDEGVIATLDEEFGNKYDAIYDDINEYGFYYGKMYSLMIDDQIISAIFYEDNTIGFYQDGVLVRTFFENVVYSENTVEFDEGTIDFYFYGLLAGIEDKDLCLDITYSDSYNTIKKDKNEYGFYYDYAYSMGDGSSLISFTFSENKNIRIYSKGALIDTLDSDVVYSKNKVISDGMEFTFSENGQVVEFNGMKLALDIPHIVRLKEIENKTNEYGFYYEIPYSALINDTDYVSVRFYDDGSASIHKNGELTENVEQGNITYSQNMIIDEINDVTFTVTQDGKIIEALGQSFVIDLYFNERYPEEN